MSRANGTSSHHDNELLSSKISRKCLEAYVLLEHATVSCGSEGAYCLLLRSSNYWISKVETVRPFETSGSYYFVEQRHIARVEYLLTHHRKTSKFSRNFLVLPPLLPREDGLWFTHIISGPQPSNYPVLREVHNWDDEL